MTKNILLIIFLVMGFSFSSVARQTAAPVVKGEAAQDTIARENSTYFDQGALVMINDTASNVDSFFPEKSVNLAKSHFTWGAEFGSSIDMTAHNLSTFDLDVNIGYKNSFFKIIGIGAGIHRSLSSGDTYVPLYAVIRTSFRKKPSLFFLNVQIGYSFNTISNGPFHGDFASALGCGINLSQSRRAKSFIILSAGTRYFNKNHKSITKIDASTITVAKIVIGINF